MSRGIVERLRPPAPRRVFRSARHERRLRRHGYAVVPFLTAVERAALHEAHATIGPPDHGDAYHHELWGTDAERKDRVAALLEPIVRPALDRLLVDHVAATHAFIRKAPGGDTAVPPHVDISFVDEDRFRSVMLWCSLDGHASGDGGLHMVPGSHTLRRGVRAHRDDASSFPDLVDEITGSWGRPVPVGPGEAVVFDHAIVHYAEPNSGLEPTLTLQCVCLPREADLLYPVPIAPGRAAVRVVDPEFYRRFSLDDVPGADLLARYEVVAEVDTPTERLQRADLARPDRARR